jgi:hypothetical protein
VTAFVHRPAPRLGVFVGMFLLAAVVLPGLVLQPQSYLTAGGFLGLGVFVAFEFLLVTFLMRRVEVSLEGDTVRLVSVRFPLSSQTKTFSRAHVSGVTLERGRRRSVRVALKLVDGAQYPLTNSYFGHSAGTDADLQALSTLLGVPVIDAK